ncbi:MAG: putative enzyme [Promethearchaeota archaeon]|nr:MAG: putative enzyme [Candidatus Lokiarchaeota archaeon]
MTEGKPDWYPMWEEIGIDIQKHDQLLAVLPTIYKEIYIDPQKNRPKAMSFWDFVVGDIHGIRISELKEAKDQGKKIVGTFCLYVPDEILFALDCIGIGLCGGTNFSNYASDELLPANTCALIKSALGFGIGNICPYFAMADLLIGETTCDGKKKAWEVLEKYKPMYVMETPQCKTREQARELFIAELKALIIRLEELTNKKLTAEKLKASMEKIAKKHELMAKVYELRKNDPVPISGKDALLMSQVAFYDDPDREIQMISKLVDELEQRVKEGVGVAKKGSKRIIVSGTPMAVPNWKIHHLVEREDVVIVGEETCTGTRYFQSRFDKIEGNTIDKLVEIIADRYLGINCACFTPNDARLEDIKQLVKTYNADGVILYTLSFCQPYEFEAINYRKELKELGIPVINITTDYSSEDNSQLKTRIDAFLEMLK